MIDGSALSRILRGIPRWMEGGLLPLAFFLALAWVLATHEPFELDSDEGLNVMKAMLLGQGHALYEDIWSDQPPLFTLLLRHAFGLFGDEVLVARLTVLACSAALMWGTWGVLNVAGGRTCAYLGVALLILLPHYLRLSVSVMVGLPALAFAMLSLAALSIWHVRGSTAGLLLSALLLAASVCTKAFTALLVPVMILGLVLGKPAARPPPHRLGAAWPALVWLVAFAAAVLAIMAPFIGPEGFTQLRRTHILARSLADFQQVTFLSELSRHRLLLAVFFLAAAGLALALRRRNWLFLYPAAWLALACLALQFHVPVWPHLTLLAAIPAAMLAAYALAESGKWAVSRLSRYGMRDGPALAAVLGVVALAAIPLLRHGLPQRQFPVAMENGAITASQHALVSDLARRAGAVRWMVTDRPMYAFRAGLPVPPALAVISFKRMATKQLTETEVRRVLEALRPELVLLARFRWEELDGYLARNYRLLPAAPGTRLYVRNDLD